MVMCSEIASVLSAGTIQSYLSYQLQRMRNFGIIPLWSYYNQSYRIPVFLSSKLCMAFSHKLYHNFSLISTTIHGGSTNKAMLLSWQVTTDLHGIWAVSDVTVTSLKCALTSLSFQKMRMYAQVLDAGLIKSRTLSARVWIRQNINTVTIGGRMRILSGLNGFWWNMITSALVRRRKAASKYG